MSNWKLHLKRLFQALCRPFIQLFQKIQGLRNPHKQLIKTTKLLERQLENHQEKEKAWTTYNKALDLGRKCSYTELNQVILKFDPLLGEQTFNSSLSIGQAVSFLLAANPQNYQNIDAAWRLSSRLNKRASIREFKQEICLQIARLGDSNALLAKLQKRRDEGLLTSEELTPILTSFLENHSFQMVAPWKAFLEQFNLDELPTMAKAELWFSQGKEDFRLGNHENAIKYFMKTLEIDPKHKEAYDSAVSCLSAANPQNLEEAWRLSSRLNERALIRKIKQEICLQIARLGDSNALLAKLQKRRDEGLLTSEELTPILTSFLENHSFQMVAPWKGFLEQFNLDELPTMAKAELWFSQGKEYFRLGNYENAIKYFMKTLEIDTKHKEAYDYLEKVYLIIGQKPVRERILLRIEDGRKDLQEKLLKLVHYEKDIANRLLTDMKNQHPDWFNDQVFEKVIHDLERDRKV